MQSIIIRQKLADKNMIYIRKHLIKKHFDCNNRELIVRLIASTINHLSNSKLALMQPVCSLGA